MVHQQFLFLVALVLGEVCDSFYSIVLCFFFFWFFTFHPFIYFYLFLFLFFVFYLDFLTGVSEAIGLAAKHYNKKSKKLAQLTKESWKISDEITALNNLKSDLDRLMAHTDDVLRETIMMHTVWMSLEVEFHRITSFFNNNSNIILGTLHIGRAHCDVVGRTGYAIQNSLLHLQIDTSNLRHGVSPMVDG